MTLTEQILKEKIEEIIDDASWGGKVNSSEVKIALVSLLESAITRTREQTAVEAMNFIKEKSERVTRNLWYVNNECLEDIPRFLSDAASKIREIK